MIVEFRCCFRSYRSDKLVLWYENESGFEGNLRLLGTVGAGPVGILLDIAYTYVYGERQNDQENDLSFSGFSAQLAHLEKDLENTNEPTQEVQAAVQTIESIIAAQEDKIAFLESRLA